MSTKSIKNNQFGIPGFTTGEFNEKEWDMHIGIQRSFLRKPNAGEWELSKIVFGRDDYDVLFTTTPEKYPENEKFYFRTDTGHWRMRPNWRTFLSPADPYAKIPIHIDPRFEWVLTDGGIHRKDYVMWEPQDMLNSFMVPGAVIDDMIRTINCTGMPDTRPLSKSVKSHIRTEFIPAMETTWKEKRASSWWNETYLPVTWEQHRQRMNDFIDDTAHLIAGCLLHHFQVWPDAWLHLLFDNKAVQELFSASNERDARVKSGKLTFDFE